MSSVKLIVRKTGWEHRAVERCLEGMDIDYELIFAEDHAECLRRFGTSESPCLVIDDHIVYHGQLSRPDLEAIFREPRRALA